MKASGNQREGWFRYGIAIVAVGMSYLARVALCPYFGQTAIFLTFFPSIILVAIWLGTRAGLLAIALSILGITHLVEPVVFFRVESNLHLYALGVFMGTNILILWICDRMHSANRRAAMAEAGRQKEARFRYFLKYVPIPIAVLDRDFCYVMVSERFLRDYHLSATDVVGRSLYDLFPEIPEEWKEVHRRCLAGTVERCDEGPLVRQGGSVDWVRWECRSWRDTDGSIGGIILYTEVITERKQAQEDLKKAKEIAEAANRAKDQFLAVLSHELRTPLTPALMCASAREGDMEVPAEIREEMGTIRRNLELEARLIDDLLDVNRFARGTVELRQQIGSVHQLILNVVEICHAEVAAKSQHLRAELAAGHAHVKGDLGRLQQLFWNLLKNAIKFTPRDGTITIRSSNPQPGRLRVEVIDTGIGIAPDVVRQLFVAFKQGGWEITKRFGGLGIGLSICKSVVDLHKGTIRAESEGQGKGAAFIVDLPEAKAEAVEKEADSASPPQAEQPPPDSKVRPAHILLVEDNVDTLRLLSRLLERSGYRVACATRIAEAMQEVEAARKAGWPFDLLISDLGLPDGDGRELMRQLRALDGPPGIAISGYGMEADVESSRSAGFREHLTKPIQIGDLKAALARVLPTPQG